jgi:hypothetical protein
MKLFNPSRIIYLALLLILFLFAVLKVEIPPVYSSSAQKSYDYIENISDNTKYILFGMEYGPGTQAENDAQAQVILEHLFRKQIKVIIFTTYPLADKFLVNTPEAIAKKVSKEEKREISYGIDWINLGFRPGATIFFQGLSQSKDLLTYLGQDYLGKKINSYSQFQNLKSVKDIQFIAYFSGLTGVLNNYIQFLRQEGKAFDMIHGCTSISVPEAYIYLESGQLRGLLEGLSGAAWYSKLLKDKYKTQKSSEIILTNSILSAGQIFILLLLVLGNLSSCFSLFKKRSKNKNDA